ncbi:sirohydrochlorin chelatase [Paenibacillus ferrarius]|uniref:sirohydrochlorin chelatase n=1 Tax=Paenibacillus ferrarius TaxID=1469647 RepID=UPI003D2AF217
MQKYGVLVISHGSRDEGWVRLVDEAVAGVVLHPDIPIYTSYLELVEGRLIQDGITTLEAQGVTDIIVVPLFVSSGSTHIDEISWALGVIPEPQLETDLEPFAIRARIHFTSPIDDDPVIADILWDRIKELTAEPKKEIVLVVGHGSKEDGFHQKWRTGLKQLAARVQRLGGFAGADVAMLLPDELRDRVQAVTADNPDYAVIVAPLFLSEGHFTRTVIPSRLEGCTYRYNGQALLPSPLISRWIERQIAAGVQAAYRG